MPYASPPQGIARVKGRQTSSDTGDHLLIAAPGPGIQLLVSKLTVSNIANATGVDIQLKAGSAIIWTTPAPANGGAIETFHDPLECGDNQALNFALSSGVGTVTVSAAGVQQKLK